MKCIGTLIVVVSALIATLPAQAALIAVGDQLIVNGDMEDASIGGTPANWSKLGGGGWEAYMSACYSGSLGVAAYSNGRAYQDHRYDGFAPDVTSLRVVGMMRSEADNGGKGRISIETYYLDDVTYQAGEYADITSDGSTGWKEYRFTVPIHHGTLETNYFSLTASNINSNTVYFDAIKVYAQGAVPEPSALIILATGLFSILAYAWRKRK